MHQKQRYALLGIVMLGLLSVAWAGTFAPVVAEPFRNTVCAVAPKLSSKPYRVPQGAIWRKETLRQSQVPEGYAFAVPWLNAATALPCNVQSTEAIVEVRAIRLYEQDITTKEERLIHETRLAENRDGFVGGLFPRLPKWFGPGEGGSAFLLESHQEVLRLDLSRAPGNVYHGWLDPRIAVAPATRHIIEAEVRITGAARVQLGLDYWRDLETDYSGYDERCQMSQNCEAWIGKWYGDTKGEWKTIRAPLKWEE